MKMQGQMAGSGWEKDRREAGETGRLMPSPAYSPPPVRALPGDVLKAP